MRNAHNAKAHTLSKMDKSGIKTFNASRAFTGNYTFLMKLEKIGPKRTEMDTKQQQKIAPKIPQNF